MRGFKRILLPFMAVALVGGGLGSALAASDTNSQGHGGDVNGNAGNVTAGNGGAGGAGGAGGSGSGSPGGAGGSGGSGGSVTGTGGNGGNGGPCGGGGGGGGGVGSTGGGGGGGGCFNNTQAVAPRVVEVRPLPQTFRSRVIVRQARFGG